MLTTKKSVGLLGLRSILSSLNLDLEKLFCGTGFDPTTFDLSGLQQNESLLRFLGNLKREMRAEDWGLNLGYQFSYPLLGPLGYAIVSAESLKKSIEVLCEFITMAGPFFVAKNYEANDVSGLQLCLCRELGYLESGLAEATLGYLARHVDNVFPLSDIACTVHFRGSKRSYHDSLVAILGEHIQYDQPSYKFLIPNHRYTEISNWYEPTIFATALRSCRKQLSEILYTDKIDPVSIAENEINNILDENYLFNACEPLPSLENMAAKLEIKTGALRQQFQKQGMTFKQEKDNCRKRWLIEHLLPDKSLSMHSIGSILGYSNPANFTRACRRWYDINPEALRRSI